MRQMTKMRLLVTAFLGAFIGGNYVLLGRDWPNWVTIPLHVLLSIGILTECAILFFSCFRVKPMGNGELCYDPENLWWKMMRSFWKGQWPDKIKICKSNWLTYTFISFFLLCIALVVAMIAVVVMLFYSLYVDPWITLACMGVILAVGLICRFCEYLSDRSEIVDRVFSVLGIGLFVCFVLFAAVIMPILGLHVEFHLSILEAVGRYLIVIGFIAGVVGLVYAVFRFKFFKGLKNTWFGQYVDKNLCPELVACPLDGKCGQ